MGSPEGQGDGRLLRSFTTNAAEGRAYKHWVSVYRCDSASSPIRESPIEIPLLHGVLCGFDRAGSHDLPRGFPLKIVG
jgi:hypothetical protein